LNYQSNNLISGHTAEIYPAHPGNVILLCANCHTEFDDSIPGFIDLPTNLDFFIEYEERDYESRINAARDGEELERSVPNAIEYDDAGGIYTAYALDKS
jgi:HNH endonuclease